MKILFTAFYLTLVPQIRSLAQTGFFLVVENKDQCPHLVKAVDFLQEYCIPEEPIIKPSEFKVEGNLEYDLSQTTQYFIIHFTKSGFETLKLICDHMPEKQLVLVVGGKAAGVYDKKKLTPAQIMPINGKADSKEIKWVFETLKNLN